MIRKLLIFLLVMQKNPKKGRRLNPFNPLTYITIIIIFIIGVIMFGFVGIWRETDNENPLRWNK